MEISKGILSYSIGSTFGPRDLLRTSRCNFFLRIRNRKVVNYARLRTRVLSAKFVSFFCYLSDIVL